jgi:hypothetical protein
LILVVVRDGRGNTARVVNHDGGRRQEALSEGYDDCRLGGVLSAAGSEKENQHGGDQRESVLVKIGPMVWESL